MSAFAKAVTKSRQPTKEFLYELRLGRLNCCVVGDGSVGIRGERDLCIRKGLISKLDRWGNMVSIAEMRRSGATELDGSILTEAFSPVVVDIAPPLETSHWRFTIFYELSRTERFSVYFLVSHPHLICIWLYELLFFALFPCVITYALQARRKKKKLEFWRKATTLGNKLCWKKNAEVPTSLLCHQVSSA